MSERRMSKARVKSDRGEREYRGKGLSRLLKSDIKSVAGRLDSVGSRDN